MESLTLLQTELKTCDVDPGMKTMQEAAIQAYDQIKRYLTDKPEQASPSETPFENGRGHSHGGYDGRAETG